LVLESLLVLVVISMGLVELKPKKADSVLTSVNVRQAEKQEEKQQAKPEPARASKAQPQPQQVRPDTIQPPSPLPSPAFIPLPKNDTAKFDISNLPPAPKAAPAPGKMMGPPDTGSPGDSKRVGTAPNGEPLYAAAWYREPSDDELRGYLSTASGPGWALIACRTVPDFRVEDCVGLDEYPDRSQMLRAVLAAAWQFRVRPPRKGGVSQVGAWVRIRIDYTERPRERE
jgi:periplasmic protein TonB